MPAVELAPGGLQLSCLSASSPPASPVLIEPVGTSTSHPRAAPPTCPPPPPPLPELLLPICLQSGCPSPSAPPPTIPLGDPVFASFPYCLSQRPDAQLLLSLKMLISLSGVSLAQSCAFRGSWAEASPVSLSPPHHPSLACPTVFWDWRTICSFDFTWFLGCNLCSTLTQWPTSIPPAPDQLLVIFNGTLLPCRPSAWQRGPGHCSVAGDLQVSFKLQLTCHLL